MKLKQLSLFLENKPGQMGLPIKVLSQAGVNIRTLSLADTEKFGILRLIVDDPDKGRAALEAAGCVVRVTEVVAVEVADEPGGLAGLVDGLENAGINIEYMYAFTFGREGQAVLIFRFEDPDQALAALQAQGAAVVGSSEFARLKG